MMQKRLLSLMLITIAVLGIGLILTQRQQPIVQGSNETGPLVNGLANGLNEVNSLRITKGGDELVAELSRQESGWVLSNRHNYPADFDKVREYLIKLSEAKIRESKTSKAENYARLGVEDLAAAEAKGLGVELGGLKDPVKLIVGIAATGNSPGTFVRRVGEDASYLVSGDVIPEKEGNNWLARQVLDLPSAEVLSVVVTAPDKSVLKVEKPDATAFNYSVLNIPKGRELNTESEGNLVAGGLGSVTLEDVLPASEASPDAATTWTASYLAYDGLAIDASIWGSTDKTWATFAARVDEAQLDAWVAQEKAKADAARATALAEAAAKAAATPEPAVAADSSAPASPEAAAAATDSVAATTEAAVIPDEFDAEKARADKQAALEQRVTELNARVSPWAYGIPTWKAANIRKKMTDMLKAK
jgi:hypothetical protein